MISLVNIGVAPPSSWGIGPGTPVSVVHRWLRHVKVVVRRYSDATYHAALLATESLSSFAQWQPVPNLHTIVYGRHVLLVLARYWGLVRCGHHCFGDGRSARHRGDSNAGSHEKQSPSRYMFAHMGDDGCPNEIVGGCFSCE